MRPRAMHCKPRSTAAISLAVSTALVAFSACKRRPPPDLGAPAEPSVSTAAPTPAPVRCSEPLPGVSFSVGERTPAAVDGGDTDDDDGTDDPSLPFAIEIGSEVADRDGFAVALLSSKAGSTKAIVAFLDADAKKGRSVELGKLHGDPDPPELAALDGDVVALMHDTDAGGELLRLVAFRRGPEQIDVVLGAEIAESRDESRVAHLELGPERGVVVWDEWNRTDKHGVIRSSTFARKDVSNVTRPRTLSAAADDAEAPRIAKRPGGFWAAWISGPAKAKPKLGPSAKPKASIPAAAPSGEPPDVALVELGQRALTIVPLDANGVPVAEPKSVTGKDSHVLGFDLEPGRDGVALLAWRDDDTAPGAEQRSVHLAPVKPDGGVDKNVLYDESVGAGVPSLLVDATPKDRDAPGVWLALDSVSDATRIGALGPSGALLDVLGSEPVIRSGDPLLIAGGRWLVAKSRGLASELFVVVCRPGAPPAPSEGK